MFRSKASYQTSQIPISELNLVNKSCPNNFTTNCIITVACMSSFVHWDWLRLSSDALVSALAPPVQLGWRSWIPFHRVTSKCALQRATPHHYAYECAMGMDLQGCRDQNYCDQWATICTCNTVKLNASMVLMCARYPHSWHRSVNQFLPFRAPIPPICAYIIFTTDWHLRPLEC